MPPSDSIPLSQAPPDCLATVARVDLATEDASRLMALGLCTGRKVQVVKQGDPMIVRVLGSHVGLSIRLAELVLVRPSPEIASSPSAT